MTACQKQDLGGKNQDVAQHKSHYICVGVSFPVYLSILCPYLLSVPSFSSSSFFDLNEQVVLNYGHM